MKMRLSLAMVAMLCIVGPMAAGSALAGPVNWTGATGNVSDGTNWDTGVVPIDGDDVYIRNGGTGLISDGNVLAGTPNWFYVGHDAGSGNIIQTGGALTLGNALLVGYIDAPGASTYDLQGGSVYSNDWLCIGNIRASGDNKMTVSNGTEENPTRLTTVNRLLVGFAGGSKGTLSLEDWAAVSTGQGMHVATGNDSTGYVEMFNNASLVAFGSGTSPLNTYIGDGVGAKATWTMWDYSTVDISNPNFYLGRNKSESTWTMWDDSTANISSPNFYLGNASTGELTLKENASMVVTAASNMQIGSFGSGHGTLTLEGNTSMTVNSSTVMKVGAYGFDSTAQMAIGTVNLSGGNAGTIGAKLTVNDEACFGMYQYGEGTLNVHDYAEFVTPSGKSLVLGDQTSTIQATGNLLVDGHGKVTVGGLVLGRTASGHGYATLSDSALVTVGSTVAMATNGGTARLNLNGGTFACPGIEANSATAGANGTVNFNGGVLKATANNPNFVAVTNSSTTTMTLNVLAGGAVIDTNSFDIGIDSSLVEDSTSTGGGLNKIGDGTLTLNGVCTYMGDTLVNEGGLAVNGSISSDVTVADAAVLKGNGSVAGNIVANTGSIIAPGNSIGELVVDGNLSLDGTLDIEYNGGTGQIDLLAVSGVFDLTGGKLRFSSEVLGSLTENAYVFATYSDLVGNPDLEIDVPANYMVEYGYDGANQIALVSVPEPSTLILVLCGFAMMILRRRR